MIRLTRKLFDNYGIRIEAEPFTVRGKKGEYVRVVQPDAVEILAISKKGILIERQYRRGIKKSIYELPAGYMGLGEKPQEAAKRELLEETGYASSKITFMFKAYQAPSRTTSMLYFYLAENLAKREKHLDDTEEIRVSFVSTKRFESMVKNNLIVNQSAIAAYLYYKSYFKK